MNWLIKKEAYTRYCFAFEHVCGVQTDFWLNLQIRCDLYKAQQQEQSEIDTIQDYQHLQKMA